MTDELSLFDVPAAPVEVVRLDEYGRERPARTLEGPRFDGATIVAEWDSERLTGQLRAVWQLMGDGQWRTLDGIAHAVRRVPGCERATEASISARLRDLRKPRFGAHTVERRRRGDPVAGCFEYRLVLFGVGESDA